MNLHQTLPNTERGGGGFLAPLQIRSLDRKVNFSVASL